MYMYIYTSRYTYTCMYIYTQLFLFTYSISNGPGVSWIGSTWATLLVAPQGTPFNARAATARNAPSKSM